MIRLILLFILWGSTAQASVCEALLQNKEQMARAQSLPYICRGSDDLYQPLSCGNNILHLARKLAEAHPELFKHSHVLILTRKDFKALRPSTTLLDYSESDGWTYHVVIDTPLGIIDMEDPLSVNHGKFHPHSDYFSSYYPGQNDILVHRVNAPEYVYRYGEYGLQLFEVPKPHEGWLKHYMETKGVNRFGERPRLWRWWGADHLILSRANVMYYILFPVDAGIGRPIPIDKYLESL